MMHDLTAAEQMIIDLPGGSDLGYANTFAGIYFNAIYTVTSQLVAEASRQKLKQ